MKFALLALSLGASSISFSAEEGLLLVGECRADSTTVEKFRLSTGQRPKNIYTNFGPGHVQNASISFRSSQATIKLTNTVLWSATEELVDADSIYNPKRGDTLAVGYKTESGVSLRCRAHVTSVETTSHHFPTEKVPFAVETPRFRIGMALPTLSTCAVEIKFPVTEVEGSLSALVDALHISTESGAAVQVVPLQYQGIVLIYPQERSWNDNLILETKNGKTIAEVVRETVFGGSNIDAGTVSIVSCPPATTP